MRIKGWEHALIAVVETHQSMPFSWDESNCVYFPMDCVRAMTGSDPWAEERGCSSEQDFKRRLVRLRCKNVGDVFALKFAEIPLLAMGRGDLAVVEQDDATPGVVCLGAQLVGKIERGMIYLPRALAVRAFKVNS